LGQGATSLSRQARSPLGLAAVIAAPFTKIGMSVERARDDERDPTHQPRLVVKPHTQMGSRFNFCQAYKA
jgi:hypothetical protein